MSQTFNVPRRTFLKASAALTAGALFNPLAQAANERRTVIIDCDPGLTRNSLRNALLNNAVDLGSAGSSEAEGIAAVNRE